MTRHETPSRILVVDDSPSTLEVLRRNLVDGGFSVVTASGVADALALLSFTPVDLVLTDLKMPGMSGLDLVRHVRENLKETEIVVITGYATIGGAVEALRTGAEDYLAKPFTDEELREAVERALRKLRVRKSDGAPPPSAVPGLLGESEAIRRAGRAIERAAQSEGGVLLGGEDGTGKELVARIIHQRSARAHGPFLSMYCRSVAPESVHEELLGARGRPGLLARAAGGTLFVADIEEVGAAVREKLALLGPPARSARKPRSASARLVAATCWGTGPSRTNPPVSSELFDEAIWLPPLRERGEDVVILARHFARHYAGALDRPVPDLADPVLDVFRSYPWPGNVRELRGVVRDLVAGELSAVAVPDLPPRMRFSAFRDAGWNRSLADVEAEHVRRVLAAVDGNKTRAAEILGIDRKTLRDKLRDRDTPE
ncbi:MAG: sigma-54 dependent transcriptional regulator [Thermoanaerobaculia bacterium]|mgnify:CR=1 FL=1